MYSQARWRWDGRIRAELSTNPETLDIENLTRSIYYLLTCDLGASPYGLILEDVEPLDPCADLDDEQRRDEQAAIEAEICAARRLTSKHELDQWLAGVYDGRIWLRGFEPQR